MESLRRVWLFLKFSFLCVFGTSRGLRNVEEEWAIIMGEDPKKVIGEKPNETQSDFGNQ